MLDDIFTQISNHYSIICSEDMKKWIDENKILSYILDPKNHSAKLIRSSKYILRFYIKQDLLDDQEIETFWMATKQSSMVKQEILSVIMRLSDKMTDKHKAKFLNFLQQEKISKVNNKLIELVYALSYSESKDAENTLVGNKLLYQFAISK